MRIDLSMFSKRDQLTIQLLITGALSIFVVLAITQISDVSLSKVYIEKLGHS